MGYETRLIVGFMSNDNILPQGHGRYVVTIASIDLCKSVFKNTYIDECDKQNPVNANIDGVSDCWQDLYGQELYGVDPQKVLAKMEAANKIDGYRRYRAAIPMLKSLIEDFKGQDLTCILYGT